MEARGRNPDSVPSEHEDHLVIQSDPKDGDVVSGNSPYSLITIRHDIPPPLIFPPINHENLHASTNHHDCFNIVPSSSESSLSESDSETASSVSTFSPTSSPGSIFTSTYSPVIKATGRITLVEMLVMKVNSMMRFVWGYLVKWRGVILNFRAVAFVAAALYFRERRRSRFNVDAIKLRDEKIRQLLDQISQMNQVLLACHRVGTNKTKSLKMNESLKSG